ncbi:hypothetical protein NP493_1954g00015 [Ridgeia piscesae]|uniref:CSN12-like protein n=1 Tax=Ridgeia piscesae TaxID=27915 RepID=A0AAD9JP31_RIDPI|nr:hypothetical protein NP493_1954g00015 [Ridgeia piscesae]
MLLVSAPSVTGVYFRSRRYWSVHQVSLVFTSGLDATGQCTKCHWCLLPVKTLLISAPSVTSVYFRSRCYCKGNLLQLNEALRQNEEFFVKCGIYLILEKLKIITYRNLFKKEMEVDDDEVECLLANLIFENKIKGYISHQHRKLVVSKQNAFPPISSLSL